MSKFRKLTLILMSIICVLSLAIFAGCQKKDDGSADKSDDVPTEVSDPFEEYDFYLNASEQKADSLAETVEVGDFILQASSSKQIVIDGNAKSPIDMICAFTKRIKLGGRTEANLDRSISFYLEKKAEIKVYAMSGSSGDPSRTVILYKNGQATPIKSFITETSGSTLEPIVFETTEAGSYYIANDAAGSSSGVNIYFIGVTYKGEATPVERSAWSEVAAPIVSNPVVSVADPDLVTVNYQANIGTNGADKLIVNMYNESNEVVAKTTVLRYSQSGSVQLKPTASGNYHFDAELVRAGEANVIKSTESVTLNGFNLPLSTPTVRVRTGKDSKMVVVVSEIVEADEYVLSYGKTGEAAQTKSLTATGTGEITTELEGFVANDKISVSVQAKRLEDGATISSAVANATVRASEEYDWTFAFFGQSTSSSYNSINRYENNIYDNVHLYSCEYNQNKEAIKKGGKFTYGSHDGISYYYTEINASEQDFKLKARVVVEYLNPTLDGQEGFALLVRDSIGVNGDAAYYYTNSVAAIATKLQYDVGATRNTITDGLGARFVTGVKSTTETPEAGSFTQKMYPFMNTPIVETANQDKDGYVIEVEKKNNCYYTRYYDVNTDELIKEYVLYHDGSINNGADGQDQLLQIDKEHVYVGFAVARGCDAIFKDIEYQVTPRSTDAIAIENEKIVGDYRITSQSTSSLSDYYFKYFANADGKLTVKLNGEEIITNAPVSSKVDFIKKVTLEEGANTFDTSFTPDSDYHPGNYQEMESYEVQEETDFIVTYQKYGDASQNLYVAPTKDVAVIGSPSGSGTKESPLDLQTAINYLLPGQTIKMLEGTYSFGANVTIERGNNGTEDAYKVLEADESCTTRPVIDFENKGTGVKMWGEFWHLQGFDITRASYGNKAIQLGGKYNILEEVNTYYNGDSGVSVSGKSTEAFDKWPAYNLVLNCTSYMNKDLAQEDADGFAAKLYCGDGNVFRGCIAYCNADDGWDLYAKTETGKIGSVLIENCLTFGNGFNIDGTPTKGNGNGFKMGGESLSGKHKIVNSVSFGNKLKGIDSNSCPDDIMLNCTSVYNVSYNYAFYSTKTTSFDVKNCISLLGGKSDQIAGQKTNPIKNETNYFFKNIEGVTSTTNTVESGESTSIDMTIFKGWNNNIKSYLGFEFVEKADGINAEGGFTYAINNIAMRNADGFITTGDTLVIADSNAAYGAKIANLVENPKVIELPEIPAIVESDLGGKKGCKSSVGTVEFALGFGVIALAIVVLLRRQKKNNQ